jgi:hypothetical protein
MKYLFLVPASHGTLEYLTFDFGTHKLVQAPVGNRQRMCSALKDDALIADSQNT